MSYERKELRLLSGSLNYLNPPDKIPAEDGLAMQNWRVDEAGALRSRGPITGGPFISVGSIATIAQRGDIVYYGCDFALYRSSDVSSPAYSWGTAARPGMVPYQGYMWVMTPSAQIKDDGAVATFWLPFAPTTALSAAASDPAPGTTNALTGTYTYYATFATASGIETNPGPVSESVSLNNQNGQLTNIPVSQDSQVTTVNIYRSGGTLGQPYRVLSVDNGTTSAIDTTQDVDATELGFALAFDHDLPPHASGLAGPYFSRLLAFNSLANPNRLWWTKPTQPAYWPGADLATGQWVDVGDDGEGILAVTIKARMTVIYKERSIWRLIGDPDTGYLERIDSVHGIAGASSVVNAGTVDYYGCFDGVYVFDGDNSSKISGKLERLFHSENVPLGGGNYALAVDQTGMGAWACGFYNDRLYFSYTTVNNPNGRGGSGAAINNATLVFHIPSQRWYSIPMGFSAFFANGNGISGAQQGNLYFFSEGQGPNGWQDASGAIPLAWQSRYEDCGAPDNQKTFLEIVVECDTGGDTATVRVLYDNDASAIAVSQLGTIVSNGRTKTRFALGTDGVLAYNISVRLECDSSHPVILYGITLAYYVEARLATEVATIPFDAGTSQVKQVKELQIDAACSGGPAAVRFSTDLPNNSLAVVENLTLDQATGRRNYQLPLSQTREGRLLRLAISSAQAFRLYAARMLARVVGVYVEAYEATKGFVWDSMPQDFAYLRRLGPDAYRNPIKQARELELDIEAAGTVTATLLTDLPNERMQTAFTGTAPSTTGRRIVRLPMPAGLNTPVEGRLYQLQLSGSSKYILYGARVELLEIGQYLEAYESAGGAVYDSREIDFGMHQVKEARELELDLQTSGPVTVQLLSDMPGRTMAIQKTQVVDTTTSTTGRRKVSVVLPQIEGRLFRLLMSGSSAFKLYGARVQVRPFGLYLDNDEAAGGAFWDTTELDLGTQNVKQLRQLELDIHAQSGATVNVYTDLLEGTLGTPWTGTVVPLFGRTKLQLPLPQGNVPNNYLFGRLVRVTVTSPGAVKLYGARIQTRPIGLYIDAVEARTGAVWDSTPQDLGAAADKVFDQVRFEMDTDAAAALTVYTDLLDEKMVQRATASLTTGAAGRRWVTVPLPVDTQGRSIRLVVSSPLGGFRIYKVQVAARAIGRFIAAGVGDSLRTLDQDFGSERVKLFKRLEVDIQTYGPMTVNVYTDQGALAYTTTVDTLANRKTLLLPLPGNVRGRLARVEIAGTSGARVYGIRAWMRPLNEPQAQWSWGAFPVEESASLAEWTDIAVPPTPAEFTWSDLPVPPTPPQWDWAPFAVNPTDPQWTWAKFPVDETTDEWKWSDIPIGEAS